MHRAHPAPGGSVEPSDSPQVQGLKAEIDRLRAELAALQLRRPSESGEQRPSEAIKSQTVIAELAQVFETDSATGPDEDAVGLAEGDAADSVARLLWESGGSGSDPGRRAELSHELLTNASRFLDRVSAVTSAVLYVFSVEERRPVFISRQVLHALGMPPASVWKMGVLVVDELMHPDDRLPFVEHLRRAAMLGDGESAKFNYRMRHADGTWRLFSSHDAVFSRWPDGRVRSIIGAAVDVTERREAERALIAAKEAAETANRAKDKFMAALSHELRTPLAPVLITAQMLEQDPRLPGDVREELVRLRRNVELEARLIDDLLDLTRSVHGKLKFHIGRLKLIDLLGTTIQTCVADPHRVTADGRSRIRIPTVQLTNHTTADTVLGDVGRLQQVFWNLIQNAIKFTPDDGDIEVLCTNPVAGLIRVEVRDNGRGINPKLLPHLFNPFEQGGGTTTARFGGLGMGLAICKALVTGQGGEISAFSEGLGRGATFAVEMPLADASTEDHQPAVEEAADLTPALSLGTTGGRRRRILLVEDHEQTARVVKRLLHDMGFDVTWAPSAELGLALAAEVNRAESDDPGEGPFELVLSDLSLPEMNGHEMMSILRDRYGLTGIAMSGYGMDDDIARSKRSGFAMHLIKPVSVERLSAAVSLVLR